MIFKFTRHTSLFQCTFISFFGQVVPNWKKCHQFILFQNKDFAQGVAALAKERSRWLNRPDHLIRAARHYEGAAQILIRHAVMTAKEVGHPYKFLSSLSHMQYSSLSIILIQEDR